MQVLSVDAAPVAFSGQPTSVSWHVKNSGPGAVRSSNWVTNTPDVLTDDVADLALALLLATSRRICAADRHVREGRWLEGDMPLTRKFSGSRVGIVGLGRIGQAIARRCAAFDCRIA